jgi:hypothetical protein
VLSDFPFSLRLFLTWINNCALENTHNVFMWIMKNEVQNEL